MLRSSSINIPRKSHNEAKRLIKQQKWKSKTRPSTGRWIAVVMSPVSCTHWLISPLADCEIKGAALQPPDHPVGRPKK
ncbi:hypothetical protein CEXT_400511 [Caerostris extrusa]|uniref:Uncharacterized protein n=1 Tax=Caerostris extrusa TaxID=172846 RepID=A0AAV4RD25_CAEEX|nr:hypothetical protein CEXT_400511 [Caerostris extrusa]